MHSKRDDDLPLLAFMEDCPEGSIPKKAEQEPAVKQQSISSGGNLPSERALLNAGNRFENQKTWLGGIVERARDGLAVDVIKYGMCAGLGFLSGDQITNQATEAGWTPTVQVETPLVSPTTQSYAEQRTHINNAPPGR